VTSLLIRTYKTLLHILYNYEFADFDSEIVYIVGAHVVHVYTALSIGKRGAGGGCSKPVPVPPTVHSAYSAFDCT
jgi:hypothetical protein